MTLAPPAHGSLAGPIRTRFFEARVFTTLRNTELLQYRTRDPRVLFKGFFRVAMRFTPLTHAASVSTVPFAL